MLKKHIIRTISLSICLILLLLLFLFNRQITGFFVHLQTPEKPKIQLPLQSATPQIPAIQPRQKTTTIKQPQTPSEPIIKQKQNPLLNMQGYTIQLMGVYNFAQLISFTSTHNLTTKTYIFRSLNKDKDWYTLVYGNYATHQAAETALNKLPKELKTLKPWIRSLESIHAAILQSE